LVARGTPDEPLLLATLPPSDRQIRLVFVILTIFGVVFAVVMPFANTPLPRLDAWVPSFTTALTVTDLITSTLLYAQFSIARQRALLVLAAGYLFSALIVIPYGLTFPGVYAPTGVLGAGLQTAVWFYLVWHMVSPLSVIAYELLKDTDATFSSRWPAVFTIAPSIVAVIALVGAVIWFCTARHDLLPVIYRDIRSLSPLANVAGGVIFLLCTIALILLWVRRTSVLDLWLMVTVSAWLLEITLNGLLLTDRFSLAWYAGRTFALVSGSVVLIMLLSEMTALYSHLARSVVRQRSGRQARQIAMDAMAASIAHEVNQPLGVIALNTATALLNLAKTPPNNDEVRAILEDIATASDRANNIISSLRTMFRKGARGRVWFDTNELVREAIATLDLNLRSQRVSVISELREGLPQVHADRGQLQQVFLNLIMNAIEAMHAVTDRARRLRITSSAIQDSSEIVITIEDSGEGISTKEKDRIFEPFFTTKSAGTGIGLTICRSIVESHGGSLRASANNPYGTIFEIVVPIDGGDRT